MIWPTEVTMLTSVIFVADGSYHFPSNFHRLGRPKPMKKAYFRRFLPNFHRPTEVSIFIIVHVSSAEARRRIFFTRSILLARSRHGSSLLLPSHGYDQVHHWHAQCIDHLRFACCRRSGVSSCRCCWPLNFLFLAWFFPR
jgi:hypothetical protein